LHGSYGVDALGHAPAKGVPSDLPLTAGSIIFRHCKAREDIQRRRFVTREELEKRQSLIDLPNLQARISYMHRLTGRHRLSLLVVVYIFSRFERDPMNIVVNRLGFVLVEAGSEA
jgi:hypothetical protein